LQYWKEIMVYEWPNTGGVKGRGLALLWLQKHRKITKTLIMTADMRLGFDRNFF
jgi:hypothetical protein